MPKLSKYGAVYAKILAMYGKRLCEADYNILKSKPDISEVTSYLKNSPAYSELLKDVDEYMVHRDQLENMLRSETFNQSLSIEGFLLGNDKTIMDISLRKAEIAAILLLVRHILGNNDFKFFFSRNPYLEKFSLLPFAKLADAATLPELAEILKSTRYRNISPVLLSDNFNYTDLENAINRDYFKSLNAEFKKSFNKEDSEVLCGYLKKLIDIYNQVRVLRLKKYYPGADIGSHLIPGGSYSEQAFLDAKPFAKYLEDDKDGDSLYFRFLYDYSKRILRIGTLSLAIIPAYLNLKEIELFNLTHIIEGIRYKIPPGEIYAKLIF